jgi:hypothetical protein
VIVCLQAVICATTAIIDVLLSACSGLLQIQPMRNSSRVSVQQIMMINALDTEPGCVLLPACSGLLQIQLMRKALSH